MVNHARALLARSVPILVLALSACGSARVEAQQPMSMPMAPPPMIAASARGETQVTPDRATVHIGVETRGETAAAAARSNATRLTRVLDAIKAAGIPAAQIRTVGFNVFPEYAHEPNREPRVTGYRTTNTVIVEVRDIAQVGRILDTALGATANRINSVEFFSSRVEEARREALGRAVEKARLDAEAMAKAAGGSLGALVELSSVDYNVPFPRSMDFAARGEAMQVAPTPIEPGEYTVSASVTARWRFESAR